MPVSVFQFNVIRMWAAVVETADEFCGPSPLRPAIDPGGARQPSESVAKLAYNKLMLSKPRPLALSTARLYTFTHPGHFALESRSFETPFSPAFPFPRSDGRGPNGGKNQIAADDFLVGPDFLYIKVANYCGWN